MAQRYHGAFPHWLNGATGATVPFSPKDNGADLVETSLLMQGLLVAWQYFNGTDAAEATLRENINQCFVEGRGMRLVSPKQPECTVLALES